MNLLDCNNLEVEPYRLYGGATGSKIGVWYDGNLYMLKTQQNVKQRNFKNVEISYANDPISEYIGSNIYNLCNIPAHETILGEYKGKICVLCRDYSYPNRVIEFKEWRNQIMDESITQHHSGMSSRIGSIMEVINAVDVFNKDAVKQRFWDMFVIDALIGNTDRNNGNWGFFIPNNILELYPVYDCGACLNNKKSDEQLNALLRQQEYKTFALDFTTSIQDDKGKRINPLHWIKVSSNIYIYNALEKLCKFDNIVNLVMSVKPIISDTRADWYNSVMEIRYRFLCDCRDRLSAKNDATQRFIEASSKM